MPLSRRDLALLLPALGIVDAAPQSGGGALPAKIYQSSEMPYKGDDRKKGRSFFHGPTHSGFVVDCHETVLGPGVATHPPHKHEHEEVIILVEGTVDAFLDGKTERAGAGSVFYFGSNLMHNVTNTGATPCRYYVIELRGKEA